MISIRFAKRIPLYMNYEVFTWIKKKIQEMRMKEISESYDRIMIGSCCKISLYLNGRNVIARLKEGQSYPN